MRFDGVSLVAGCLIALFSYEYGRSGPACTSAVLRATPVTFHGSAAELQGQPGDAARSPHPCHQESQTFKNKVRLGTTQQWRAMEDLYWQQRRRADQALEAIAKEELYTQNAWMLYAGWYPCPLKQRVGDIFDGGKWLCSLDQLIAPKKHCTVFSLGSAGETSFETAVKDLLPNCQIHTFDPSLDDAKRANVLSVDGVVLHEEGIGAAVEYDREMWDWSGKHKVNLTSVANAMERDGIEWVDILKMDIEGFEFEALAQYFEDASKPLPATFLLVEIHLEDQKKGSSPGKVQKLIAFCKAMETMGFRAFNQEPNVWVERSIKYPSNVIEMAFINVDKDGLVLIGPPPYDSPDSKQVAAT